MNEKQESSTVPAPALHSIDPAAYRLGVSPWSLRVWIRQGAIRATRLGRRVLIPESEIQRVVAEGLPSLHTPTKQLQPAPVSA